MQYKDIILGALLSALIFIIITVLGGMGYSEATAIIKERGNVEYVNDTVYITLPQSPSTIELEAATKLTLITEGTVIQIIN